MRTSRVSSPTTAWNLSLGSFVFRESHPIGVPPLPITPHIYPPPLRVVVGACRSHRSEVNLSTSEDVPMHSLGYELPRTPTF